MKKILSLVVAVLFLAASCKKESSTPTCTLSAAAVSGNYKLTAVLYKASSLAQEIDLFLQYDACEKDNIYTFNPNGTYTISDGVVACSPSDADAGLWSLNGTTMTVDDEAGQVSDFSCSGFKAKLITDPTVGETTTLVFARQ
jgi:hypothetical protein